MEKKTFYLNQDHRTVSILIPILLIILIVIGYRVFYRTLPLIVGGRSGDYILIAGVVSLFASAFLLWLADPFIKRFLPSGHTLTADPAAGSLNYAFKEETRLVLPSKNDLEARRWFFRMGKYVKSGRERQIPRNWVCMSILLTAEGKELVLYCYARPSLHRKFAALTTWDEINMAETVEDKPAFRSMPGVGPTTKTDAIPSKLLVGDKGKVWLAERKRRESGIEMAPKDFGELLTFLNSTT